MRVDLIPAAKITDFVADAIIRLITQIWRSGDDEQNEIAALNADFYRAKSTDGFQVATVFVDDADENVGENNRDHRDNRDNERNETLVACACGATRVVRFLDAENRVIGAEKILAVFGVSVKENFRGRGFGRAATQAQFARINRGEYQTALCFADTPEFYAKIGARRLQNHFIDSLNSSNPPLSSVCQNCQNSAESSVPMVYPATAWQNRPAPDMIVDLPGGSF